MINFKSIRNRKIFRYPLLAFAFLIYICYILPFLNNVVFDSIIHFAYAETFIKGIPFQYNLHEHVTASTSPFWTLLLILFFYVSGFKFIILLKIFIVLVFTASTYYLFLISRDIWKMKGLPLYVILVVWLINVSVIKNSFGGMENILSTFQVLFVYYLLFEKFVQNRIDNIKIAYVGLISGWALLTRPETGMICFGLNLVFILKEAINRKQKFSKSVLNISILLCAALVILLPWHIYQYRYTGSILPDSAISRTYLGKWFSIIIIRGFLYLHPELLLLFGSFFLPFTVGIFAELSKYFRKFDSLKDRILFVFSDNLYKTAAIAIIFTGFIFYSVVVGGVQTGRYFLSYYPFVFITGISGLRSMYLNLKSKHKWQANGLIIVSVAIIFVLNAYDYKIRVFGGKDIECAISDITSAPLEREPYTSNFLKEFNYDVHDTVRVAISEVQFRYFVDYRIYILSLDGRTSLDVFKYTDKDGFPDFEKFFMAEKPDIVEVKGWYNMFKGFPYRFFKYGKEHNIIAEWDNKISHMNLGEKFFWKGNEIQYIVPGYVKIIWHNS